jgi:thymidylate synthase (FAD)
MDDQYTSEENQKLIKYLVKHGHTSPFRHPHLSFRIKCPIYVERQLFKHQIGVAANSLSGRYVDFSDSYSPVTQWRAQSKSSKQGSAEELDPTTQVKARLIETEVIRRCESAYQKLLEMGVSKEQARTILPLNLNTEFYWTGSLQAFIHMMKLRLDSHAQKETRDIALLMLNEVKNIPDQPFQLSLNAFEL